MEHIQLVALMLPVVSLDVVNSGQDSQSERDERLFLADQVSIGQALQTV